MLAAWLTQQARAHVEEAVRKTILREHNFEGQVAAKCKRLAPALRENVAELPRLVRATLEQPETADQSWPAVVDEVAKP